MDLTKTILGQHWPFYSHQKLYDMVRTEAKGPGAVADADHAWMEFVTLMAESRQNIERLLNEAGASWEGLAGDSMRDGVTPLAQWADDSRAAGEASGGSVRQVGESFAYASNAMPEPVRVTAEDGGFPQLFADLFGGQTDQDRQERLAQESKRRAVELMEGYSTNASAAVSSVGTFVPPQEVTVGVAPAQPLGGRVGTAVGVIVTEPPPSPGGGSEGGVVERDTHPVSPGPGSPTTRAGHQPSRSAPRVGDDPTTTPSSFFTPATPVRDVIPSGESGFGSGSTQSGGGAFRGSPAGRGSESVAGERQPARGFGGTGSGSPAGERHTGARGASTVGRHAATSVSPLVPPVGFRREEDAERRSADYLQDFHDEFWEADQPEVAPPVIGADDPEEG